MYRIAYCFMIGFSGFMNASVVLKEVNQDSSVKKNGFICPSSATGDQVCVDQCGDVAGLNMQLGQTAMIFSPQAYWIKSLFHLSQGKAGAASEQAIARAGGYCLLITTEPLLASIVKPELVAQPHQIKVVTQLWCNGNAFVELWAQDAALVQIGGTFSVSVSSVAQSGSGLHSVLANQGFSLYGDDSAKSWKTYLYASMGVDPAIPADEQSSYQQATQSPRSVVIVVH